MVEPALRRGCGSRTPDRVAAHAVAPCLRSLPRGRDSFWVGWLMPAGGPFPLVAPLLLRRPWSGTSRPTAE